MKNKKLIYTAAGFTLLFMLVLLLVIQKYENYLASINQYFTEAEAFKQYVIQNVATYDDYKNSEIEKELRTYLLLDHLKIASDQKYEQVKNNQNLETLIKDKKLVFIESGGQYPFYFYNVPKELRYSRPFTKDGLNLIADRFNQILFKQQKTSDELSDKMFQKFKVKLAISSVTRPVEYQKSLRGRNENASVESTHSYGISMDIFYDEYFVGVVSDKHSFKNNDFEKLKKTHGFALGSSLRRQFQTVLSKTMIELQREHKLYAILETNQRCYHVTILPK